MKLSKSLSLVAMTSLAGPAMALDLGGGFSLTGKMEYSHIESSGSGESFGYLEGDLVYEHASGFGAFLGTTAISAGSSEEALYWGLTYSGDFGKVQIGSPRGALDDYISPPSMVENELLDLSFSALSGSYLPSALLGSGENAIGLRYDGSFGAVNAGISYHQIEDADFVDLAMDYTMGQTKFMAGIEHVSEGPISADSYSLGAEHDFGQVTAGVILSHTDLSGNADSVRAYAVYSVNDRLDITGNILSVDSAGPNGTMYSLSAKFDLSDTMYFGVGYLNTDDMMGPDDIASVSLGVTF